MYSKNLTNFCPIFFHEDQRRILSFYVKINLCKVTTISNTIHFILTGGTVDSYYEGSKDTVLPNEHSVIPEFIKSLKLYEQIEFNEICMKDSREINQQDRQEILKTIEESPYQKIIITHGTYTMPDSTRYLKANLKRDDQTIVFTASMAPVKGFAPSDGPFNLGFALAQVEILPPGVYVAINGKVFQSEEIIKLIGEGRFASIFQKE